MTSFVCYIYIRQSCNIYGNDCVYKIKFNWDIKLGFFPRKFIGIEDKVADIGGSVGYNVGGKEGFGMKIVIFPDALT